MAAPGSRRCCAASPRWEGGGVWGVGAAAGPPGADWRSVLGPAAPMPAPSMPEMPPRCGLRRRRRCGGPPRPPWPSWRRRWRPRCGGAQHSRHSTAQQARQGAAVASAAAQCSTASRAAQAAPCAWMGRVAPLLGRCSPAPAPPPPACLQPSPDALTAAQQGRAIDLCATQLASRFDARLGGFGGAPKFPRPAELNLLLAQHARLAAAGQEQEAGECGAAWCVGRSGGTNLHLSIPLPH